MSQKDDQWIFLLFCYKGFAPTELNGFYYYVRHTGRALLDARFVRLYNERYEHLTL